MMASGRHGTLYTGVTARIATRIGEHRSETFGGFTAEYGVKKLVWLQHFESIESAIRREKQIKKWRREWKINLIEPDNPNWDDLAVSLFGYPEVGALGVVHIGEGSTCMGPRLRGDDES